jgi:hypothetical protein
VHSLELKDLCVEVELSMVDPEYNYCSITIFNEPYDGRWTMHDRGGYMFRRIGNLTPPYIKLTLGLWLYMDVSTYKPFVEYYIHMGRNNN